MPQPLLRSIRSHFLPRNFFSFGNFAFTAAWIFRLNSCCRLLNQNKPQRTSLGGSNFFLFLATVISNLFTQFKQTPNKREAQIYFERIIDSSAISENFNLSACKHASHEGPHSTVVAFLPLTQWPWVLFLAFPEIDIMFLRFINSPG